MTTAHRFRYPAIHMKTPPVAANDWMPESCSSLEASPGSPNSAEREEETGKMDVSGL